MTPSLTAAATFKSHLPAVQQPERADRPQLPCLPEYSDLIWRTASTGLGTIKWAAAGGLLASAAGLGSGAVAACAIGAAGVGSMIWVAEMASLRHGFQLPHVTLQHALCNELHTLAGGLLGATPVAAGLTALGACWAGQDAAGHPALDYNGLALLTGAVAGPTAVLLYAAARALPDYPSPVLKQLAVFGLPLTLTGAVLVAPALALQASVSSEAASRFVITFGAGMACAAVREGFTQASARAWGGIERSGFGASYGLSQAQGADRLASTAAPTAASCLLFAATTSVLLHYVEASYGLGFTPAGQSVLTITAAEAAQRTALRYTLMQSTNELLEGVARCLPLAAYARMRGIPLRYRDNGAGAQEVPVQLRRKLADPETLRRAALFASARTMDGAVTNMLSQLSTALSPAVFWNGYRIAAVLVQGGTMVRTPFIAAWLLPGPDRQAEEEDGGAMDVVVLSEPNEDPIAESSSIASNPASGNSPSGSPDSNPLSDASLQWA